MRLAHLAAAVVLVGLLAGLLGAAALARADGPPESSEPPVEGWSADPRLWLALIEWRQRLRLELGSSRELCTAGTLTEVSWGISGGTPPYALQVEGVSVDAGADNVRINCGALSEAEAADGEAALAAKWITAVVTDARGVRREAALDVPRARALPAPTGLSYGANVGYAYTTWDWVEGAGSQSPERREYPDNPHSTTLRDQYLVRYRAAGGAEWQHAAWATSSGPNVWETIGPGVHEMQVAAIRHSLESETPSALRWSETLRYAYGVAPANPTISTTATTVTVSWDAQPYAGVGEITLAGPNGSRTRIFTEPIEPGRHSVTFSNVPPATSYELVIDKSTPSSLARGWTTLTARTDAPPAGWTANPTGPQNVTISTSGNEITVTWTSPYPGAPNRYDVVITEESTGALVDIIWVTDTTRQWSTRGIFRPIRRGGTYRVRVTHVDLITASVYKTVTVPASTASGAEDAESTDPPVPPIGSFFPFWPLRLNADHAYTDDPFEWRVGNTDSHDATLAETTVLRYNAYDAAGAAASAGSYAFLSGADGAASVVATYEDLRDGTASRLLIHKADAQGMSRATLYDAVAPGDFFEWRESDDCWVRYRVTEVLPDPSGSAPRKLFAVEWTTYAFTGCSGAIAADTAVVFDWGPLPDLGGPSLAVPIRHGPFQIVPEGWEGQVEEDPFRPWPANSYAKSVVTADLAEARRLPHWRDPTLPSGWTLLLASSGDPSYDPPYGYCAFWANDRGYGGVEICGGFYLGRGQPWESSRNAGRAIVETRMIAGRPAIVVYSPAGPNHNRYRVIEAWVYDPAPDAVYNVMGFDWTLNGSNVDAVIAIARSLFEK